MTDGGFNPNGMAIPVRRLAEINKAGFTQIPVADFIKMPVDALGLYEGTINTLAANDVFTVRQLAEMDEDQVAQLVGIGCVRREEIKQRLAEVGLCFGCVFDGETLVAPRPEITPGEAVDWLRGNAATGQRMMRHGVWQQEFHAGSMVMFQQCADLIGSMRELIDELGQLIPCEKPEISPMPIWIQDLIDRRKAILEGS